MKNENQERVSLAAIWYNDGTPIEPTDPNINMTTGFAVMAKSHAECTKIVIHMKKIQPEKTTYGFMTTHYCFVDRNEAWEIALAAEQIDLDNVICKGELHSEDLFHLKTSK